MIIFILAFGFSALGAENFKVINDPNLVMEHLKANIVMSDGPCVDSTIQYRLEPNSFNMLWFTPKERQNGLDKMVPISEDGILKALRQNLELAPWTNRSIKSVELLVIEGDGGYWRIGFCQ